MLPKQIQMKNFGPYVDETVDFEALLSGGLFLITGDTGAGKTTILDAMSFALFGKTTGEKRMAKEFRSHFADIEAKCEVKFTFTHQNYTYIITRQPTMEIQKRNGKVSNPKAKAYLEIFDEKGQLMDTKSGIKKVDAFMSELLQLTSEQFNQIILLPQGKFQEFLISDSENKTQILRTIFNTQLYQQLTDTIKQNYLQKEKLVNHQVEQLQRLSQQLNAFDGEELPVSTEAISLEKWPERMLQILSSQKDQLKEQSTQLEKAKHTHAELQTTFHQAQTIFNQQAEGQKLLAQQATLQSQADKIATLQTKIQNLNWLNQQRHDLEQYTKEQQKLQLFKKNQQQTCQQLAQNEGEWQIFIARRHDKGSATLYSACVGEITESGTMCNRIDLIYVKGEQAVSYSLDGMFLLAQDMVHFLTESTVVIYDQTSVFELVIIDGQIIVSKKEGLYPSP